MKKILSIALSLVMILSLLCAGAVAAVDLSGVWYGDLFGFPMVLTLNADGNYTIAIEGEEPSEGVWEMKGGDIVLDKGTEEELDLVSDVAGTTLTTEIEGTRLVFSREPIVHAELAAPRTDATSADYEASWVTYKVHMMGLQLDPRDALLETIISYENGLVALTFLVDGENTTVSIVPEFENGMMILNVPFEDGHTGVVEVQLLEDGTMTAYTDMLGFEVTFLMETI